MPIVLLLYLLCHGLQLLLKLGDAELEFLRKCDCHKACATKG